MPNDLLITRHSALPVETVCRQLTESAVRHQFGVLATHNLREKIESKGLPFGRECRVIGLRRDPGGRAPCPDRSARAAGC